MRQHLDRMFLSCMDPRLRARLIIDSWLSYGLLPGVSTFVWNPHIPGPWRRSRTVHRLRSKLPWYLLFRIIFESPRDW